MNSWLRLTNHSWPCSTGSSCPAARRSVAFAALFTPAAVEALRVLFLEDLLTRPLTKERQRGELLDRAGGQWEVFDIDGTREAARQRALPKTEDLPPAQRRLDEICNNLVAQFVGFERKRGRSRSPAARQCAFM